MSTKMETLDFVDACLQRLKSGDRDAVKHLMARSYDRLLTFSRHQLKAYPTVGRYQETVDVLHEVFIKLLKKLTDRPPNSAKEFFLIVSGDIRNHLIDQLRYYAGRRSKGSSLANGEDKSPCRDDLYRGHELMADDVKNQTYDPHKLQLWSEFHEAVRALPEELQQVADLKLYNDLSQQQIADVLGVGRKVVRNRWTAAKLELIDVLPDQMSVFESQASSELV